MTSNSEYSPIRAGFQEAKRWGVGGVLIWGSGADALAGIYALSAHTEYPIAFGIAAPITLGLFWGTGGFLAGYFGERIMRKGGAPSLVRRK